LIVSPPPAVGTGDDLERFQARGTCRGGRALCWRCSNAHRSIYRSRPAIAAFTVHCGTERFKHCRSGQGPGYQRDAKLAVFSRSCVMRLCTCPPLRWMTAANSERWVTAMMMPSTTTSLILYAPLRSVRCHSTLTGGAPVGRTISLATIAPSGPGRLGEAL